MFTNVDNHGLTHIIAGCLVSDERYDSYCWAFYQFQCCSKIDPDLIFTDGDLELARGISSIFPKCVHLLCRFHIAQNIAKALASTLRADLNSFLGDFWRIGSIEEMDLYEQEFAKMELKWENAAHYLQLLKKKQDRWAFAFTHQYFVAGISSTQRQESINYQVKKSLLSNSTLERIINGFENVETATAAKMLQAVIDTKLTVGTDDPIIAEACAQLTSYAAKLLKAESSLSLSYASRKSTVPDQFRVSHKDCAEKYRLVTVDQITGDCTCSCRKPIWHGILCRHVICALRWCNVLSCPIKMFNSRWRKNFVDSNRPSIMADLAFHKVSASSTVSTVGSAEDIRFSKLSALCKTLIMKTVPSENVCNMVTGAIESLLKTVGNTISISQARNHDINDNSGMVRNPLKVKA